MADEYLYLHLTQTSPSPNWIENPPVILGSVVVNIGGDFTLTLYDDTAVPLPPAVGKVVAIIKNTESGDTFPYNCRMTKGLSYTLEAPQGQGEFSVTITYAHQ